MTDWWEGVDLINRTDSHERSTNAKLQRLRLVFASDFGHDTYVDKLTSALYQPTMMGSQYRVPTTTHPNILI